MVRTYCMYVLAYTPSLLRVLRVFQNQYKQISQNHLETPKYFAPRHGAFSLEVTDLFMMGPTV